MAVHHSPYEVECQDRNGIFIRGLVIDHVRKHLVVDFHCDGRPAESVPVTQFFAVHRHTNTCKNVEVGGSVHVFLRPSRNEPRGWYLGKVIYLDKTDPNRTQSYNHGFSVKEYEFIVVDVKFSEMESRQVVLSAENVCALVSGKGELQREKLPRRAFERFEIGVPSEYLYLTKLVDFAILWEKEARMKCIQVLPNYSVTVLRPPKAPRLYLKTFRKIAENMDRDSPQRGSGSNSRKRAISGSESPEPRKKLRGTIADDVEETEPVSDGPFLLDLPGELLVAIFGRLDLPKQIRISSVCARFRALMMSPAVLRKAIIPCKIFKDSNSLLNTARLLHLCLGPHIKHLIFKPLGLIETDLLAKEEELFGLQHYVSLPMVARILSHLQIRLDTLVINRGKPTFLEISARDDNSALMLPAVTKKLVLLHSKIDVNMFEYCSASITIEATNATFSFVNDDDPFGRILKTLNGCCGDVSDAMRADLKTKLADLAGDAFATGNTQTLLMRFEPAYMEKLEDELDLAKLPVRDFGECTVLLLVEMERNRKNFVTGSELGSEPDDDVVLNDDELWVEDNIAAGVGDL